MSLQRKWGTVEGSYDKLGITGERAWSCFSDDHFKSKCGRFQVRARNCWGEGCVPQRFRVGSDPTFYELWSREHLVGRVKNRTFAIHWLLMKIGHKISLKGKL